IDLQRLQDLEALAGGARHLLRLAPLPLGEAALAGSGVLRLLLHAPEDDPRQAALGRELPAGAVAAGLALRRKLRGAAGLVDATLGVGKIVLRGGELDGLALAIVAPVAAIAG